MADKTTLIDHLRIDRSTDRSDGSSRRWMLLGSVVERRVVRLGSRTSAGQIVLSGLTAGSRVVVGDLEALSDGAKVRVASQGTGRQGGMS